MVWVSPSQDLVDSSQACGTFPSPQKVLEESLKKTPQLIFPEGLLQCLETPKAAALKRWAMGLCSLSGQFIQFITRQLLAHHLSPTSDMETGRELACNTQVQCNCPPGRSWSAAVPAVLEELREETELPSMNLKYCWCKKEVPVKLVGFQTISLILPALWFPTVVLAQSHLSFSC